MVAPRQRTGFFGDASRSTTSPSPSPTDSDVQIRTGSADITVEGPVGTCRLKSGSGDVQLDTVERPGR